MTACLLINCATDCLPADQLRYLFWVYASRLDPLACPDRAIQGGVVAGFTLFAGKHLHISECDTGQPTFL